ncbi:MAG: hypothetical protein EHM70_12000, partial [Chloroflexota bacterium]
MHRTGRLIVLLFVFALALPGLRAFAYQGTPGQVAILSPLSGQALRGSVPVIGNTLVEGFQSAELSFAYDGDATHTWFWIADLAEPVADARLADWDTSTLTDGNYALRLMVTRLDGSHFSATMTGLRVRNYTPIETETLTPSLTSVPGITPVPTATLTPIPTLTPILPTPTLLPANPAQVSPRDIQESLLRGVL